MYSGIDDNIAVEINEMKRISQVFHLVGDLSTTYDFSPRLSLKAQVGIDYSNARDKAFEKPVATFSGLGELRNWNQYTSSLNANVVLNYNRTYSGIHNISALVGIDYRRDRQRTMLSQAKGFPGGLLDVMSAGAKPTMASGYVENFRTAGYFVNLKYNFDQSYFISGTIRYSGSSRFGSKNRWGLFPAISAAWVVSKEDFFKANFVNFLKLRASYGSTGNSYIGRYESLGLFSVNSGVYTASTYNGVTGLNPTQLANPFLSWERATQLNIGFNATLFNGRLTSTFNIYRKTNSGLLLATPLPSSTGFTSITKNAGKIRNSGIEFSLNTINIRSGDFQWSTQLQLSVYKNEVLKLSKGVNMLFPGDVQPIAVGHSLGALHVVEWAGVNPVDGRPMWYTQDGKLTYNPKFNRDAEWHDGSENDVTGGLGTTFNYKGLTLDVFFQYSLGKHAHSSIIWNHRAEFGQEHHATDMKLWTHSWQEPGDLVAIPAPIWGTEQYPGTISYANVLSTNAWYDASYIRLKTVRLSYSLPTSLIEKMNISNLMFYISGLNLLTWTSWPGLDPEVNGAFVTASYPSARRITGGIEIKF